MTLDELIERLQDIRDRFSSDDLEVLVIHQPNYPLQEVIGGVRMQDDETNGPCGDCGRSLGDGEWPECGQTPGGGKNQFVYVVANGPHHTASPYGPRRAFEDAG